MKVTISDVAKLAGVSTATVSHTINNTRYVSGETKDLIESVGLAKEAGARIVAITNYVNSTLAGLADATLLSYGKTNLINAGTFSSVVSQMFLLDIITSGYAVRYSDEVAQSQAKVGWSLLSKTTS